MRLGLVCLALLLPLAGCSDAPAPPTPPTPTEDVYVGGDQFVLDDETRNGTVSVTVTPNLTALRMELVFDAVASQDPRVFGIPECEWREQTLVTDSRTEIVDCAAVVPGAHLLHVEHDGGSLRMTVRVVGEVPEAER